MEQLNVKAGDKVRYVYNGIERIVTVTEVMLGGRIKIDLNSRQFNKYGREIGDPDDWWPLANIYEATPEDVKRIKQKINKPKKPIFHHVEGALFAVWTCPECRLIVGEQFVPTKHNQHMSDFCKQCGQAINWKE